MIIYNTITLHNFLYVYNKNKDKKDGKFFIRNNKLILHIFKNYLMCKIKLDCNF